MPDSSPLPPSQTRRYLLIAFAVAVAVGLFALVWELRSAQRPSQTRLSAPGHAAAAADQGARSRGAGAPRLAASEDPPVASAVAGKEDQEDAPVVPLAEALADAARRIQDDLRECEPREDSSGVITVSYAVVFDGGVASIDDARMMRSSLSAELQDCALDRIRAARWEAPGVDDHRARRVESFVVGAAY